MRSKETLQTFTYQTRLHIDKVTDEILGECAELLSSVERRLFAELAAGKKATDLKSQYLKDYGITARHFNAIRIQLEGKISSIRERQSSQIAETKIKIASVEKTIQKLAKNCSKSNKLHQKKRYLWNLNKKLDHLEHDKQTGKISLCFGTRKLFCAQFNLEKNGYKNIDEWRNDWKSKRNSSFFLLGSKDESMGNQTCTAMLNPDNSINLRLRLPDRLATKYGKYLVLSNVSFKYGHKHILEALCESQERKHLQTLKDSQASSFGIPISYRLKKDNKGWTIFVNIPQKRKPISTSPRSGVIGIDINSNHLAVTETDRFGNPIAKQSLHLNTYGKRRNQSKALIGDVCANLIKYAKERKKPLIIEELNFQKKKAELKENSRPVHARMLSSLTYNGIKNNLKNRAWKEGVEILEVNPAFTSIIGRVKFSRRYGLSVHQAAALTIGRRFLEVSERVPRHLEKIPDGKEGYVTLSLPARNRDKHVWSAWRIINRKLRTVLAAHFRATKSRSSSSKPAPVT